MTFTNVLVICTGAIAVCAALVFAVETLVAFCFHEQEREQIPVLPGQRVMFDESARETPLDREMPLDKAA